MSWMLAAVLSAALAVYHQWNDGVRGYGNTKGALHSARSLWFLTAGLVGLDVGRLNGLLAGVLTVVVVYVAGDRLVAVLDRLAARYGPRRLEGRRTWRAR